MNDHDWLLRNCSEGIWLSGKTLHCRPRDCEFDPPPHSNLNYWKRRYILVLPQENAPLYQCFTLGTLKNLVCHVSGRSSILHYGPLIVTNYLYAPTPNVQIPSASLNKIYTPPLRNCPFRNPLLSWSVFRLGLKAKKMALIVIKYDNINIVS